LVFKQVTNLICTKRLCDFSFFFHSHLNPSLNLFRNGRRPASYLPQDYTNDVGNLIKAMESNTFTIPNKNMLICPSVSTGPWSPEDIWNTGLIEDYGDNLYALAVEQ
jgi:hypothetical protein